MPIWGKLAAFAVAVLFRFGPDAVEAAEPCIDTSGHTVSFVAVAPELKSRYSIGAVTAHPPPLALYPHLQFVAFFQPMTNTPTSRRYVRTACSRHKNDINRTPFGNFGRKPRSRR